MDATGADNGNARPIVYRPAMWAGGVLGGVMGGLAGLFYGPIPLVLGPVLGLLSGLGVAFLWCRVMTIPAGERRVWPALGGAIWGALMGIVSTLAIHVPLSVFVPEGPSSPVPVYLVGGLILGLICGVLAGAICGGAVALAERAGRPGLRK